MPDSLAVVQSRKYKFFRCMLYLIKVSKLDTKAGSGFGIGNREYLLRQIMCVKRSDRFGQKQMHQQTGVTVKDKDL